MVVLLIGYSPLDLSIRLAAEIQLEADLCTNHPINVPCHVITIHIQWQR